MSNHVGGQDPEVSHLLAQLQTTLEPKDRPTETSPLASMDKGSREGQRREHGEEGWRQAGRVEVLWEETGAAKTMVAISSLENGLF